MLAYIRTPRAAVAAPNAEDNQQNVSRRLANCREPIVTLWASRPFMVHAGPLVAVRLRGDVLEVCLAAYGRRRWVAPDSVLTPLQAHTWVMTARFVRATNEASG